MSLPSEPILRAAVRWLELLPASGVPRARSLLTSHPNFSDLTPTQYGTALSWLGDLGLLGLDHSDVPTGLRILGAYFENQTTPWLRDADALVQSPDELPGDVLEAAESLGVSANDTYAQLRTSWGKVDTRERERVGAAGETELVDLLRRATNAIVEHVAAFSDGFGYDIAVTGEHHAAHLEVKSTTRRNRLSVYLSRNEFEVMLRDPNWVLIAVRLTPDLKIDGVGSVPTDWIRARVPQDIDIAGRWASCRLDVPPMAVDSRVSALESLLIGELPHW